MISSRLASILEMRKTEPDGREHGPAAYVFGDEVGGKVKGFKTAWKLTCKRAGTTGLRFHDLRWEAGSRLIEAPGASLADVRDFLGHRDVV
jgi:integrase